MNKNSIHEKIGYLQTDFKLFHLHDEAMRSFNWHYHDFHKILWVISGNVNYHVEGKNYRLQPYDMLLIRRGEIHKPEVDFGVPYERYILYISDRYLKDTAKWGEDLSFCFQKAGEREESLARLSAGDNYKLLTALERLEKSDPGHRFAGRLYTETLFLEFIIELNRMVAENNKVFGVQAHFDPKIIEIMQYINAHLAEDLTVENLSGLFYISKYHMMRKFKEETGYSVHQYILEKRILMAKDKIINGTPVTNACMECGFKDYSTFNRAFKMRMLVAPSELKSALSRKNT